MNYDADADTPFAGAQGHKWQSAAPRGRILLVEDDNEIAEKVVNDLLDRG